MTWLLPSLWPLSMQVAAWSPPPRIPPPLPCASGLVFEVACSSYLSPLYLRQHASSQALSRLLHTDGLPLWAGPYAVATWEEQVSTDNFTVY